MSEQETRKCLTRPIPTMSSRRTYVTNDHDDLYVWVGDEQGMVWTEIHSDGMVKHYSPGPVVGVTREGRGWDENTNGTRFKM